MATVSAKGAEFSAREVVIVMGSGTALILLVLWLAKREVQGAAAAVGGAVQSVAKAAAPIVAKVNPFDQENIAATTANAVYKTVSGKPATDQTTLATWLSDFTWVNDYDPNADTPRG